MAKKKKVFFIIFAVIVVIAIVGYVAGKKYWDYIYAPNVKINQEFSFVFIPTGSDFDAVCEVLKKSGCLRDLESFIFVATKKKYNERVLPGKYKITNNMSNNELINLLRSGKQTPVRLTFISVRSLDILAGKAANFIEADSIQIASLLGNPEDRKSVV